MEREIKFKYIVKRKNGFTFFKIFSLKEIEIGSVKHWVEVNKINSNDIVICQFIGLKDINGKEIYEGDIIKCTGKRFIKKLEDLLEEDLFKTEQYIYYNIIEWWSGQKGVGYRIRNGRYMRMIVLSMVYNMNIKVLGSIHQNPELLTK